MPSSSQAHPGGPCRPQSPASAARPAPATDGRGRARRGRPSTACLRGGTMRVGHDLEAKTGWLRGQHAQRLPSPAPPPPTSPNAPATLRSAQQRSGTGVFASSSARRAALMSFASGHSSSAVGQSVCGEGGGEGRGRRSGGDRSIARSIAGSASTQGAPAGLPHRCSRLTHELGGQLSRRPPLTLLCRLASRRRHVAVSQAGQLLRRGIEKGQGRQRVRHGGSNSEGAQASQPCPAASSKANPCSPQPPGCRRAAPQP